MKRLSPRRETPTSDGKLDTLSFWQRDERLVTLTDDENVGKTGSELPLQDILDVNDIETTVMPLSVSDDTGPSHVTTTSDHDDVSNLELDVVNDLVVDEIELDGVVDLDVWIGVSDGSTVVGDDVRNSLGTELVSTDLEELEAGLLWGDSVDGESTLDVVKETEVLAGSLEGDDI